SAAGRAHAILLASVEQEHGGRPAALAAAFDAARSATRRAPHEDELWRLESDAALALARSGTGVDRSRRILADPIGQARDAETAARAALRVEPLRANNYERLGNALAAEARAARAAGPGARGEPLTNAATAAFAEAERRAPSDALVLTDEVSAELALGRPERALVPARKIVGLYPEAATGHALEGAAWLALGRVPEARAALERARAARWEPDDSTRRAVVERLLQATEASPPARR